MLAAPVHSLPFTMVRLVVLALIASIAVPAGAWVSPSIGFKARRQATTVARRALDYNDPIVAEEFAKVQPMDFEDVEEELMSKGIPVPAAMNEMDVKVRSNHGGKSQPDHVVAPFVGSARVHSFPWCYFSHSLCS
jgi:hypothetical protein